jgi:hypothetical protein
MEDNEVARKFISAITGEEVIELAFSPQEYVNTTEGMDNQEWKYCRLDFIARIHTDKGIKAVMIEVQKASIGTDIRRFRRYLGSQYQLQNLEKITIKNNKEIIESEPIPIYCIFVLGDGIGIKDVPVVTVNPKVADNATGNELSDENNEFITNLNHRSWIIQVPELKNRRNNDTEVLLSIFDQTNRVKDKRLLLKVREENFPQKYRPIIRRLELAAADESLRKAMQDEDDFVIHERKQQATIAEKEAEKEAAIAEKDAAIAEKDAAIAALAKERAEKEALLAKIAALEAKSNTGKGF